MKHCGFFNDAAHMKACFGLDKRKDGHNIYAGEWTKLRINKTKYSHTKELVTALAQAFDDITIEVFSE